MLVFDINVWIKYWLLNSWESRTSCYKCCHFNVLLSPRPLSVRNDSQVRDHSFCIASICASCNTSIGGQKSIAKCWHFWAFTRKVNFQLHQQYWKHHLNLPTASQKMPLFALMHIHAESMHIHARKVMPYCSCSSCHVPAPWESRHPWDLRCNKLTHQVTSILCCKFWFLL